MSIAAVRPRFRVVSRRTAQDSIDDIVRACDGHDAYVCRVLERHVDITVAQHLRHRWSPCVQMEFTDEEGSVVAHGVIGPHPNVWTLYAVITAHFALIALFGLPFGFVQLSLGHTPWALWVAAGGMLGVAGMYALSQLGRRLSREETRALMDVVERAVGAAQPED